MKRFAIILVLLFVAYASAVHVPIPPQQFNDSTFRLFDNADPTKRMAFELSGITTGNTRTITAPDADMTLIDWTSATESILTIGDISCDELTLTTGQDFAFTSRATNQLCLQGQANDQLMSFELYTKKGDAGDNLYFQMFGKGTPASQANYELLLLRYVPASQWWLAIGKGGAGTDYRPFHIRNGGNDVIIATADSEAWFPQSWGHTVGGTNADLYIDDTGKIGQAPPSSIRYKENIRPLPEATSSQIYSLQPRIFDRIDGSATDEIGLIAEEANAVMPDIVGYKIIASDPNITGKRWEITDIPERVNYDKLIVRMLAEIQRLRADLDDALCRIEVLERGRVK